jgi:hypothetical protein
MITTLESRTLVIPASIVLGTNSKKIMDSIVPVVKKQKRSIQVKQVKFNYLEFSFDDMI